MWIFIAWLLGSIALFMCILYSKKGRDRSTQDDMASIGDAGSVADIAPNEGCSNGGDDGGSCDAGDG